MSKESLEQVATEFAVKATYGGAGTGFIGWLMNNNIIGLLGLLIAVAGFLVNWYYKHKHYKLAELELQRKLKEQNG